MLLESSSLRSDAVINLGVVRTRVPVSSLRMTHDITFTYDGGKTKTYSILLPSVASDERVENVKKGKQRSLTGFIDVMIKRDALIDVTAIEAACDRKTRLPFALLIARDFASSAGTVAVRRMGSTPLDAYKAQDFPGDAPFISFILLVDVPASQDVEHELNLTTGVPGFRLSVKVKRK